MAPSKHSNWGFRDLGPVNIANIQKEIDLYLQEWLIDTSRQEEFETHEHTFMYAIKQLDYKYDLKSEIECKKINTLKEKQSQDELEQIVQILEKDAGGKAIRIEFINMKPQSRIRTHKDRSDLLYVSRRYHVPIKTNDKVVFKSGPESKYLEPGHAYELNNIKYHSVYNNSSDNRVHLIIDILPDQYLGNVRFEQ